MAAAAVAVGADGLLIEVHPLPEKALSDGYQSLDFHQFAETMALCRNVADAVGKIMAPPAGCGTQDAVPGGVRRRNSAAKSGEGRGFEAGKCSRTRHPLHVPS
jgi:hypothetical protein